jgi:phosphoribosylformylglycinamidine cyclo-ligase
LHTNGYSLARKLFFDVAKWRIDRNIPELNCTLGEALLQPHINYTRPILHLLKNQIDIKGMAHITGGGFLENIPRVLPNHCQVEIKKGTWPALPIFSLMQELGHLNDNEMYRTFNMGIGLVMMVDEIDVKRIKDLMNDFSAFKMYEIGQVVAGEKSVVLC